MDTSGKIHRMLMTQRACPEVPPPLWERMDPAALFLGPQPAKDTRDPWRLDLDRLRHHLLAEGRLRCEDAKKLILRCRDLCEAEPNLLELATTAEGVDAAPNEVQGDLPQRLVVVGDIHGQFYDLVKLVTMAGMPRPGPGGTAFLFLGDYVDRGCFSCEVLIWLCALKCSFPGQVFLLRGNHECRHLTRFFNFKEECMWKYGEVAGAEAFGTTTVPTSRNAGEGASFYDSAMASFDSLPLTAVVGGRVFCVHGGLSPSLLYAADVDFIQRFREVPSGGSFCDLLWADPDADLCDSPSEAPRPQRADPPIQFTPNDVRECSFFFNAAALEHFLRTNNLQCVIRAHEMQPEGFKLHIPTPGSCRKGPPTFPPLVSVFSAPNYCGTAGNRGAFLTLSGFGPRALGGRVKAREQTPWTEGELKVTQFHSTPRPYYLPGFVHGFTWSLPFVGAKLLEAMEAMLDPDGMGALDDESDDDDDPAHRAAALARQKILAQGTRNPDGVSGLVFRPQSPEGPRRPHGRSPGSPESDRSDARPQRPFSTAAPPVLRRQRPPDV